jgi:hypothetical protein
MTLMEMLETSKKDIVAGGGVVPAKEEGKVIAFSLPYALFSGP